MTSQSITALILNSASPAAILLGVDRAACVLAGNLRLFAQAALEAMELMLRVASFGGDPTAARFLTGLVFSFGCPVEFAAALKSLLHLVSGAV